MSGKTDWAAEEAEFKARIAGMRRADKYHGFEIYDNRAADNNWVVVEDGDLIGEFPTYHEAIDGIDQYIARHDMET
jgi:phosphopantetheinyl transferase (holo-ACP synthase)